MTLDEILRKSFALAHRRVYLLLLDVFWKALWLAATLALVLFAGMWFAAELQSLQWESVGSPIIDRLLAATILRQFWHAHSSELFWVGVILIGASLLTWLLLEAYFRHLLVAGGGPLTLSPRSSSVKAFFVSGFLKMTILASAAGTLALIVHGHRGASIAGLVAFFALAFLMTIFDTLIRSNAVDLFGTELIKVSGVIGVLVLFEAMIAASLLVAVIAGFLNVASFSEAIVMLAGAISTALLWSIFHSYLLLVRFAAVGIMSHDVVEF